MIQRIQTVYLLIIIVLIVQTFFFPFVSFFNDQETISFTALQFNTGEFVIPLAILVGVILSLAFISVFLFKNRLLQIRITFFNLLLLVGLLGLIAYFVWELSTKKLIDYQIKYNFTCIYPLISIVLASLAIRGMKKDEALIRSVNRIR